MNEAQKIVVVGGGHAAAQLCASLVEGGAGNRLHLVCEEPLLPYQRPPLSKSFLKNATESVQAHRSEAWYAEAGISVHLGDSALSVDRAARSVSLRSGAVLSYGHLVLATGTRARQLPQLTADLVNVFSLRSAADAARLREKLMLAQQVTVLGGGFIGLEIAATARALGKAVTVLESAPRLLARSVSAELAAHVLEVHRGNGIDVRLGVAVGGFEVGQSAAGAGLERQLQALHVDGQRQPVELLVLGVGAVAEHSLASAAGLDCENGIVVDACMRSSDPHILAIGDCTAFPEHRSGRRLRLESVQNANDQARTAAATLLGREAPYQALPWFWSEQGGLRLQMAGLIPHEVNVQITRRRRPGASASGFSILHYQSEQLVCVESVNSPMDHIASRKLLEAGKSPPPMLACDVSVPLKTLL